MASIQHEAGKDLKALEHEIRMQVLSTVFHTLPLTENTLVLINPVGHWTVGRTVDDSGLTGCKLAVDTYGGRAARGGEPFSYKDPSKVDRSGA